MGAIMRGRHAFIRAEHDRRRMVAYEQARWVAFAFHDPKNLPDFKALATPAEDAKAAQAELDDARVRGWFIAMSMREH
jgi:hypothetical protein